MVIYQYQIYTVIKIFQVCIIVPSSIMDTFQQAIYTEHCSLHHCLTEHETSHTSAIHCFTPVRNFKVYKSCPWAYHLWSSQYNKKLISKGVELFSSEVQKYDNWGGTWHLTSKQRFQPQDCVTCPTLECSPATLITCVSLPALVCHPQDWITWAKSQPKGSMSSGWTYKTMGNQPLLCMIGSVWEMPRVATSWK